MRPSNKKKDSHPQNKPNDKNKLINLLESEPIKLRLDPEHYLIDLGKICKFIRENQQGNDPKIIKCNLMHKDAGDNEAMAVVILNYAFDKEKKVDGSLYMLGFVGKDNRVYFFNDCQQFLDHENIAILGFGSTYANLGFPTDFNGLYIQHSELANSINNLNNYTHNAKNKDDSTLKKDITKLVIVSSEALRSKKIADGIDETFKNSLTYSAQERAWDVVHNWGGNNLCDDIEAPSNSVEYPVAEEVASNDLGRQ
jgi:hypothetical protein